MTTEANRRTKWGVAMNRREFLHDPPVASVAAPAAPPPPPGPRPPLEAGFGPQLFLDDSVIGRMDGLERRVNKPQRRVDPVLDSKTFGTTQPYVTVRRDGERFRLWYNRGPAVWHAESGDGVHWGNPRVAWDVARGYGASLVDDGEGAADPRRRFKLANWQAAGKSDRAGMYVGFSPDGSRWSAYENNPVLPTWPDGPDKVSRYGVGDIVDVYFDPLNKLYRAAVKLPA